MQNAESTTEKLLIKIMKCERVTNTLKLISRSKVEAQRELGYPYLKKIIKNCFGLSGPNLKAFLKLHSQQNCCRSSRMAIAHEVMDH